MMDAATLIGAVSGISSEEEFEEKLSEIPPQFALLIRIAIDHMGDEIDFSFAHPQLGLKGRITGEGLSQIVQNAAKFIK